MAPRAGRAGLRVGAALVACASVGAVVARAEATPPARLRLHGGAAWVASSTVGQLTLIDGSTAEVVARAAAAPSGADLASAQDGAAGFGLDRDDGAIVRVDPATQEPGLPVRVMPGARGDLSIHPHGDRLYVVDRTRGRVAVADAATLARRGALRSLAEPAADSVVDGAGRLWTLGAHSGDLTWFDGDHRGSRRRVVPDPASASLTVVAGRAAVVERGARLVRTLDAHGGGRERACLDIDPDDRSVEVGGSVRGDRLFVVSGDDGMLRVSSLGSGRCGDVALAVAAPQSRLGAPQEAQGRVFVPDYTRGTAAVVDLDARRVVHTRPLVAPGTRFELFPEDGIVFYNDPGSERAGVVAVDGTFSAVEKYDPDRPGEGLNRHGGQGAGVPDTGTTGGEDGATGANGRGSEGATTSPTEPEADAPHPDDPSPSPGQASGTTPAASKPGAHPRPAHDPGDTTDDTTGGTTPADGSVPTDDTTPPPDHTTSPPDDTTTTTLPPAVIEIKAPAIAVEVGDSLTLTAEAGDPANPLESVTWDFGDQTTGSGISVSHTWSAPRDGYTVTATGTFASGTAQRSIGIQVTPPAVEPLVAQFGFGPTPVRAGDQVNFMDQSSGQPTSWEWSFEEVRGPATANEQNPSRFFDFAGSFTVTLTVRRGPESSSVSHTVDVADALPDPLVVSQLGFDGSPPLDDQTVYKVFAIVSFGQIVSCTFTVEGVTTDCHREGSHAGVEISISRTFPSGRSTVVQLHVVGGHDPGDVVDRSTAVTIP
jgi:PKD repeat protein